MDLRNHHPDTDVGRWAGHQMAGSRCSAPSQVAHRFEAPQEPLPRLRWLQAPAVARPIAYGAMAALDGFGRFTTRAVQPRPDVASTWARSRHGLDVRLVVIGHDLIRHHTGAPDRLAKERPRAPCIAVVAKKHIDDYAVLVDGTIPVALVSLAEQGHSSTNQRLPTGGRRRRTSAVSCGPKACTQSRTVRCETSMLRSASSSRTCRLESG
jgi:hypothetical protein